MNEKLTLMKPAPPLRAKEAVWESNTFNKGAVWQTGTTHLAQGALFDVPSLSAHNIQQVESVFANQLNGSLLSTPVKRRSAQNKTGLPDQLKANLESLSGMSMDAVRVHYDSSRPAKIQALAYTRGTEIHVAPGQERHLAHESWHVVQQMMGRVRMAGRLGGGEGLNEDSNLEQEATLMGEKAKSLAPWLIEKNTKANLRPSIGSAGAIVQCMRSNEDARKNENSKRLAAKLKTFKDETSAGFFRIRPGWLKKYDKRMNELSSKLRGGGGVNDVGFELLGVLNRIDEGFAGKGLENDSDNAKRKERYNAWREEFRILVGPQLLRAWEEDAKKSRKEPQRSSENLHEIEYGARTPSDFLNTDEWETIKARILSSGHPLQQKLEAVRNDNDNTEKLNEAKVVVAAWLQDAIKVRKTLADLRNKRDKLGEKYNQLVYRLRKKIFNLSNYKEKVYTETDEWMAGAHALAFGRGDYKATTTRIVDEPVDKIRLFHDAVRKLNKGHVRKAFDEAKEALKTFEEKELPFSDHAGNDRLFNFIKALSERCFKAKSKSKSIFFR